MSEQTNKQEQLQAFYAKQSSYGSVLHEGSITSHTEVTIAPAPAPVAPAPVEAVADAPPLFSVAPAVKAAAPKPPTELFASTPERTPEIAPPVVQEASLVVPAEAIPPTPPPVFAPTLFPSQEPPRKVVDNSVPLFQPAPAKVVEIPSIDEALAEAVAEAAGDSEAPENEKTADTAGGKRKRRKRGASDAATADDLEGE